MTTPTPKQIYAVYDNVAEAIIGGLYLHFHDAPAIRMYSDVANMKESTIGIHPEDYDLLQIGTIHEDGTILPERRLVLAGKTWLAAQQSQQDPGN